MSALRIALGVVAASLAFGCSGGESSYSDSHEPYGTPAPQQTPPPADVYAVVRTMMEVGAVSRTVPCSRKDLQHFAVYGTSITCGWSDLSSSSFRRSVDNLVARFPRDVIIKGDGEWEADQDAITHKEWTMMSTFDDDSIWVISIARWADDLSDPNGHNVIFLTNHASQNFPRL